MQQFFNFFNMGGYAFFVWTSYFIVAALFTYGFIMPIVQHRQLLQQLDNDNAT